MNEKKKRFIERTMADAGYKGKICGFTECAKCGGICCRTNACACVPEEFPEITEKFIENLLDSRNYMITAAYELTGGNPTIPVTAYPIISAREVACERNGIHISMMHSKCALFESGKGCRFSDDERPVQGLTLIPYSDEKCENLMDLPVDLWKPYRTILDTVVKERTGSSTQELFEKEFYPMINHLKISVQKAVVYGKTITVQEEMAVRALISLGAFKGIYGAEIGAVVEDFIELCKVDPLD